jgi:hypothetical protein
MKLIEAAELTAHAECVIHDEQLKCWTVLKSADGVARYARPEGALEQQRTLRRAAAWNDASPEERIRLCGPDMHIVENMFLTSPIEPIA